MKKNGCPKEYQRRNSLFIAIVFFFIGLIPVCSYAQVKVSVDSLTLYTIYEIDTLFRTNPGGIIDEGIEGDIFREGPVIIAHVTLNNEEESPVVIEEIKESYMDYHELDSLKKVKTVTRYLYKGKSYTENILPFWFDNEGLGVRHNKDIVEFYLPGKAQASLDLVIQLHIADSQLDKIRPFSYSRVHEGERLAKIFKEEIMPTLSIECIFGEKPWDKETQYSVSIISFI